MISSVFENPGRASVELHKLVRRAAVNTSVSTSAVSNSEHVCKQWVWSVSCWLTVEELVLKSTSTEMTSAVKEFRTTRQLTMEDVVNRRVSTDVMSWKRRELAAPDSRAPLLLRRMACSSPANKLMRITLSALHNDVLAFVMDP